MKKILLSLGAAGLLAGNLMAMDTMKDVKVPYVKSVELSLLNIDMDGAGDETGASLEVELNIPKLKNVVPSIEVSKVDEVTTLEGKIEISAKNLGLKLHNNLDVFADVELEYVDADGFDTTNLLFGAGVKATLPDNFMGAEFTAGARVGAASEDAIDMITELYVGAEVDVMKNVRVGVEYGQNTLDIMDTDVDSDVLKASVKYTF